MSWVEDSPSPAGRVKEASESSPRATPCHQPASERRSCAVSFHPVASVVPAHPGIDTTATSAAAVAAATTTTITTATTTTGSSSRIADTDVEPTATVPPLPPPAAAALPRHTTATTEEPLRFADHHHSRRTSHKQSKLTLSAFRRSSVRLTRADPAQKLEDHYEFRNPSGQSSAILGHGAFSTVRRAVRRADQLPVAVKSIAKHEALRARRLRVGRHGLEEWEILRKFRSHPFIVNLMEVFETEDEIILVLEYCQGGELFNAIQRRRNRKHAMRRGQYTESQAAVITSQILKALNDLHAAGIVHRDVKPENILLTETNDERIRVKLCDFGMARSLGQGDSSSAASEVGSAGSDDGLAKTSDSSPNTPGRSRAFSIVGSDYYAAPEITYGNPYDTAVDMYSLGVTLYILLCGFPPCFSGPNSDQVIFPNSYWSDVSQDAKDLVKRMLCREPLERITAREALRDKWIWQHLQYHKHRPSVLKPRVARFASPERCSNLDVIRNQLYQNLTLQASMKRPISLHPLTSSPPKRRRNDPRSSSATLLALADLYRGVAQSPVAKVLSVDPKDVRGAPQTPNPDAKAGCAGNSPASSPLRPLSV